MGSIFYLKRAETLLGVLKDSGQDFPWHYFKFEPTAAFDEVRPLFDRRETDCPSQKEASQQNEALGLRLVDATDGEEVKNSSLLYINGHEARLRC
jgi:hypothetical protein